MSYKNATITLLMIAIVGFAMWATVSYYRPSVTIRTPNVELPDATMEDVVALVMDKFGHPSMKILTPRLLHFAENNTTKLISPKITLFHNATEPWYITAKYGKASEGADQVDFWDDVTLYHPEDKSTPDTWIKTSTLSVQPSQQTASTNDSITLTQANFKMQSVGMQADIKNGNIKLLSKARGEYVPNA